MVAEVIKSGVTKSGKRGSVGPRAHLVSFLAQACSILPDYVLVFAKVPDWVAFADFLLVSVLGRISDGGRAPLQRWLLRK